MTQEYYCKNCQHLTWRGECNNRSIANQRDLVTGKHLTPDAYLLRATQICQPQDYKAKAGWFSNKNLANPQ